MDTFPPRVGEVILRPIRLLSKPAKGSVTYIKEAMDIEFPTSEDGDLLCWAQRSEELDNAWVMNPDRRGLVCFIHGDIPENYTHFTITSVGRNVKHVHVKPEVWPNMSDLFDIYVTPSDIKKDHEQLVKRVMEILRTKPDLLPVQLLAKRMSEAQFKHFCATWHRMHGPREMNDAT